MTKETATHLNTLRARAHTPIILQSDGRGYRIVGASRHPAADYGTEIDDLLAYVETLHVMVAPQAIEQEIRRAASERRDADTYTGEVLSRDDDGEPIGGYGLLYWGQVNGHADHAGGIALALVMDQIVAEIARHNQMAHDRYEAYRLACEQGVAVPPAEATTKAGDVSVAMPCRK